MSRIRPVLLFLFVDLLVLALAGVTYFFSSLIVAFDVKTLEQDRENLNIESPADFGAPPTAPQLGRPEHARCAVATRQRQRDPRGVRRAHSADQRHQIADRSRPGRGGRARSDLLAADDG